MSARAAAAAEAPAPPPLLSPRPLPLELRRIPYPYSAMLAICSDLDETPDAFVYREVARFLNTAETTSIGPGIALEVGNTIYFDMPRTQFAYWNTDDRGRAVVRALIRSGHIDCLHSYGDLAIRRDHAARALDELSNHGCELRVWIDHATAPSNFGQDIMRGRGDVPGSETYHADLTIAYGIRYVWRGRVTSVIGQDIPRRLTGLFDPAQPAASLRTIGKELAKGMAARAGSRKYAAHRQNAIMWPVRLRSGEAVHEFLRANPHAGGVSCGDTAAGLAEVLTPRMLQRLVSREGICILYTHLGKVVRRDEPLPPRTREALRRLAERSRSAEVLVTTTRRILDYCAARRDVSARLVRAEGHDRVELTAPPGLPLAELQGITIYVPEPRRARVWFESREIAAICVNPPDRTGRPSLSIPWTPLAFPRL